MARVTLRKQLEEANSKIANLKHELNAKDDVVVIHKREAELAKEKAERLQNDWDVWTQERDRLKGYREDLNGQMKINKEFGELIERVKKERDSAINDKVTVAKENVILKDKVERLKAMTKAAIDEL